MVASHLDEGLVELEAGGGEGIEVGSVHGRGGDKRPINLVVGYSVPGTPHCTFSFVFVLYPIFIEVFADLKKRLFHFDLSVTA